MTEASAASGTRDPDQLVSAHLDLAYGLASRYRQRGLPLEDLRQEALLGLLQAARRFDPGRGAQFSTYAAWWIKKQILQALRRESSQSLQASSLEDESAVEPIAPESPASCEQDLALPDSMPAAERRALTLSCQQSLTLKEIAARMDLSVERVKQLRAKALRRLRSQA